MFLTVSVPLDQSPVQKGALSVFLLAPERYQVRARRRRRIPLILAATFRRVSTNR